MTPNNVKLPLASDSEDSAVVEMLFNLRLRAGKTQKELAALIGCSQPNISYIENMKDAGLSLKSLVAYATALGYRVTLCLQKETTHA